LVVCTDASTYSLSLLEVFLDNLAELRKKANFVVHRLLLSRVSLLSETQRNHVQRLRRLGVRRMQETVLWQDELFASQADLPLVAPSGTPLFRSHAQLALEWLLETADPKSHLGTTSTNAPLARKSTDCSCRQIPSHGYPSFCFARHSGFRFTGHCGFHPSRPAGFCASNVAHARPLSRHGARRRFGSSAFVGFRPDGSRQTGRARRDPDRHRWIRIAASLAAAFRTHYAGYQFFQTARAAHVSIQGTVLCLVVFCPQETDERDEMELTVGSVLSVLHQPESAEVNNDFRGGTMKPSYGKRYPMH
jgi:hypothetical protein